MIERRRSCIASDTVLARSCRRQRRLPSSSAIGPPSLVPRPEHGDPPRRRSIARRWSTTDRWIVERARPARPGRPLPPPPTPGWRAAVARLIDHLLHPRHVLLDALE